MVKQIREDEFVNEIEVGVVVVDFFAEWCGPCKMLSPVIDSIAEDMDGKVKFIKVDVDECSDVADEYEISNIPAVVIFKDGEKQELIAGFNPKEVLVGKINRYL